MKTKKTYYAKGGVTEHGLKKGDTIVDDMFWSNEAVVKDKEGKLHKVNLNEGKRYGGGGKINSEMKAGGTIKYWMPDEEHYVGTPSKYMSKDLLQKVNYDYLKSYFIGNFGWKTPKGMADGYLFDLDEYDQNLVKNIKLKEGETIFRYFNEISAIGGFVMFIKINVNKLKAYFLESEAMSEGSIKFETRGIDLFWINLLHRKSTKDKMAKGGVIVTSIKDIPNFKKRLEEGKITYRGLGLGKVYKDFYKAAGTGGVRIKVDGKEYFITDKEFDTFSRNSEGKMAIKFDAPQRKYEDGGMMEKGGSVGSSLNYTIGGL